MQATLGLKSLWSAEERRRYYPAGIPPCAGTSAKIKILFLDMQEDDLHEEGLEDGAEPVYMDRIKAQARLINFGAKDEVKAALDLISRSPPGPSK